MLLPNPIPDLHHSLALNSLSHPVAYVVTNTATFGSHRVTSCGWIRGPDRTTFVIIVSPSVFTAEDTQRLGATPRVTWRLSIDRFPRRHRLRPRHVRTFTPFALVCLFNLHPVSVRPRPCAPGRKGPEARSRLSFPPADVFPCARRSQPLRRPTPSSLVPKAHQLPPEKL